MQFQSLGHMPMGIDIDNGDDIEATFMGQQACWHKTCRLKFNQTKLEQESCIRRKSNFHADTFQSKQGRTQRCYLLVL